MNFENILFIAPNYKKTKGGIASVLKQYDIFLGVKFNYCSSIFFQNIWLNTLLFPINILLISLKLIRKPAIQLVHIQGSAEGSFYRKYVIYLLCKKIFRKLVVYHIHASHYDLFYNESSNFIKKRIQYLINNCDQIIVLSEEWLGYFNKTFTPKRINILENIVPEIELSFDKKITSKIKILFLGRIGNRKGIFDLLDCLNENKDIFKNEIELIIGGDGQTNQLKEKIEIFGLSNVHFLGWIDSKKKEELLITSDILILPSYNEGLPISILEAMSYGLPVIATNVGGIPRVLNDGKNGVLIEPGNIEQIKSAIELYIKNPELIQKHGKESLLMVEPYYPKNVFKKLESIYASI